MARALHALLLALGDLSSPRVRRVLAQSLALTLLIFVAAGAALFFGARWGIAQMGWLGGAGLDLAGAAVLLLLVAGSWLLFRGVGVAVVGLFADAIVADVEARHYPAAAARAVDVGWRQNAALALASLGRLVLGNLAALPFYLLLLVTGVGTVLLALAVNALLLGRDLEAMVSARHPDRPRFARGARWSLGLLSAASFLVPVANILAPILGAAMAVHMLHMGSERS
ncbi:EI24 domain-containing protein (plasmid) [Sphingopyxis indica]|uniref:EI24 domain-containing protein n=1 Tax=Sphingopyxis indica TaxID=436663 RepID=UPI002938FC7C|nr:EI24 domain-containing protein [Sphingopyxis indica]WOF45698.1 EI24 domain-containing protein [Sphingopyxis indica]